MLKRLLESIVRRPATRGMSQQTDRIDYKAFWIGDSLRNIVPPSYGDQPEGWDPVQALRQITEPYGFNKVLDFGCGYGRLAGAFDPEAYVGIDLNPSGIERAADQHPGYLFREVNLQDEYPMCDLVLAYAVFLHLDDTTLVAAMQRLRDTGARYMLVSEILGREWRRPGNPPVFNREESEYRELFSAIGFSLASRIDKPYARYADNPQFAGKNTDISFLMFARST